MAETKHLHPDTLMHEVNRALVAQYGDRKADLLMRDLRRWKSALESVASWGEGPVVDSSFDHPGPARTAREALTELCQGSITWPTEAIGIPAMITVGCVLQANHYTPHQDREGHKWAR